MFFVCNVVWKLLKLYFIPFIDIKKSSVLFFNFINVSTSLPSLTKGSKVFSLFGCNGNGLSSFLSYIYDKFSKPCSIAVINLKVAHKPQEEPSSWWKFFPSVECVLYFSQSSSSVVPDFLVALQLLKCQWPLFPVVLVVKYASRYIPGWFTFSAISWGVKSGSFVLSAIAI